MENLSLQTSPLYNSYQDTRKEASLFLTLCVIPVIIQGTLLHPKFSNWRILRWVRLALTPLSVYIALKLPLDFCFGPSHRMGGLNFGLCIWGTQVAMKAIQFGLSPGYIHGRFWTRKEAALSQWDQAYTTESDYNRDYTWAEIIRWSMKQTISPRGIQYGWGKKVDLNNRALKDVIMRLFKVHLLSLMATAGCVLTRDFGSPTNVLLALGFRNNLATKILAEGLFSLSFPAFLLSWFDIGYCWFALLAYSITRINEKIQLPEWIMEWFDVRLYPAVFQSPHVAKSLNELWSKRWHQFLRADLVFFGAKPAIYMAKKFNLSKTGQQISSLWAVFFISGVLHELYIHSTVKSKISLEEYYSMRPFPGALFYFMMQPVGIMLEPLIIPRIPKILGGGTLWVWLFSLGVIIPYRNVLLGRFGILDEAIPSLSKWPIYSIFIPGSLFRAIDGFHYYLVDKMNFPTISDVMPHFNLTH